ncbi:MAG: helix-turn-helix transcriptional regulator [Sedimentisphaerales bacterium]|nr:helix-turn-helix transcriptional regulator [Sedimentisphaerales bacterium]
MDMPNQNIETQNDLLPIRSTFFRTPHQFERELGLWVDRIGHHTQVKREVKLRLLGLYGIVYVERGEGFFSSPITGELQLKAGDVAILFPEIPHRYAPYESWDSRSIVWDGPDAQRLEKLGYLQPDQPIIHGAEEIFETAYQRLNILIHEEDHASILERKLITEKLILDLFNFRRHSDSRLTEVKLVQDAIDYLQAHAQESLSIPEMACQFNVSSRQFQRLFKKYSGRNPREMVMTFRISHAKTLLLHGATVKEAAVGSGYNDMFYFIRVFKKLTGDSPGKWQKKHIRQTI